MLPNPGLYLKDRVLVSTLQQRVSAILSDASPKYGFDEPEGDVVDEILEMLKKAEKDLDAAETRVKNLKWQLAKAREHQA